VSKKPIIISLLVLLAIWAIAALIVHKPLSPTPWAVIYSFVTDLPRGLGWHILMSSWRILASMFITTITGVPLGLWLGQNHKWDK
jgi:NitT/TauT family transport system permease protein